MARITVIIGHYGSGKTDFAVNLAIDLIGQNEKVAICDLDIANPYFRSRERKDLLEEKGIKVISNIFNFDIAEDLPAISPAIMGMITKEDTHVVLDVGGDSTGAMILNQYRKELQKEDTEIVFIINGSRMETDTANGCLLHMEEIINETGLKIDCIVNNTHMLSDTTADDVFFGHNLCKDVTNLSQIPLKYDIVEERVFETIMALAEEKGEDLKPYKLKLYMRPTWLDHSKSKW